MEKIRKLKNKFIFPNILLACTLVFVFTLSVVQSNKGEDIIQTSASYTISNKKIGWGIKRNEDHLQPDVGAINKNIMNKYEGIYLGNKEKKYIYLTFDNGYEAGYTEKILEVLKQNNVPATFFLTAHYINSEPDLVKKMIDEGHILGNQFPQT